MIHPDLLVGDPAFAQAPLEDIIGQYGTPLYLYHAGCAQERAEALRRRLNFTTRLYYAVKANPNPDLLKAMRGHVDGLDISSGGELQSGLDCGYDPAHFSFAGPGKRDEELELAIRSTIGSISVESVNELARIDRIAGELGQTALISVRVNPQKLFRAFAIKMGGRASQFGVSEEDLPLFFQALKETRHCRLVGLHIYSGTQCLDGEALIENVKNTLSIAKRVITEFHHPLQKVNLGGGFGIPYYEGQTALDGEALAGTLSALVESFVAESGNPNTRALLELGRYLTAPAGLYLARIIDKKVSRERTYCVLDGGMNHHLPASGNFGQVIRKNYRVVNLSKATGEPETVTLVGPLCTSIDVMGDNVRLAAPEIGDVVAFGDSGSYAFTASPHRFLSHPTPPEVIIHPSGAVQCSRERQLLD